MGKSWLVRTWGTERFGRVVEVNLERRPETAASCFADNDPKAILQRLEVQLGQRIPVDGSALLFLDEIQAVPEVLAKLRWFAEEIPKMPVITAGSLLDFTLAEHRFSMPVGRISYLHLEPMGFVEFCHACGEGMLARWLDENLTVTAIRSGVPAELHAKAAAIFRSWVLVGEACQRRSKHLLASGPICQSLMCTASFSPPFATISPNMQIVCIIADWQRCSTVCPASSARSSPTRRSIARSALATLKQALDLLVLARVCHRVVSTRGKGLPAIRN